MTLPEITTPAELANRMGWSERHVRSEAKRLGIGRALGNRLRFLPEDVQAILKMTEVLTLNEVANALRVSRSWLQSWLAKHPVDAAGNPFYVPMGRRNKTFEMRDISRIRLYIQATGERPNKRAKIKSATEPAAEPTPDELGNWLKTTRQEDAVYFIAVREFIKIGWTQNWRKRIAQMQTANPDPIKILRVIGRPAIYEKTMHKHFAKHRARGEWFADCPEIREHIESLEGECWYRAGRRK